MTPLKKKLLPFGGGGGQARCCFNHRAEAMGEGRVEKIKKAKSKQHADSTTFGHHTTVTAPDAWPGVPGLRVAMQNLQNLLGNGQRQRKAQQERDVQLERERQRVAQLQEAPAPAKPPRPAVMTLEDAPIAHDQPNPRDLYAVEGALKKDFDPVTRQWTEQVIRVQIERKPFAEGAMRAAYRMKIVEGMHVQGKERFFVLKLSKDPHEKTSQYYKDVELQMESRMWASEYNKRGVPKKVDFIPAHVVILTDRPMKPTCTMVRERAVCCRLGIRLTGILGNAVPRSDSWRASMSSTMTTGRGATTSATPRRPSRTLRGRRQEISCSSATCKASVIAGLIPRCSQCPRGCGHTAVMAPV